MENYKNISSINLKNLVVEETFAFGFNDKLIIKENDIKICQFYYNMRGFNQDFYLKNKDGVQYHFGGDKSKAIQIGAFKKAIREGFTYIKIYGE